MFGRKRKKSVERETRERRREGWMEEREEEQGLENKLLVRQCPTYPAPRDLQ